MRIDIACNITSEQFKNPNEVIERAKNSSTIPIFVGVDFESSKKCLELAKTYNTLCYVGLHPTHSKEHFGDEMKIQNLLEDENVIAIGECGLDYLRSEFSSKEIQKKVFINQLEMKGDRYFLHSRDSHRDFMEITGDYSFSGVVHSFTGTEDESKDLIRKGFFIGINGCSLKTEEGLEMVKSLPLDKILVETDSPYCKIRKSYAGYKFLSLREEIKILRKRNEPCSLDQVIEVISKLKEVEIEELNSILLKNSEDFFGIKIEKVIESWRN
ncbi:Putative deoxyribonuclease TATDN1 [Nosema bombycis CQ1]|uniref:Putative deoxyribonuclease TATDN1 n=1 Tax=Nosema bombycis (strain CQ1 / CVCC 102059) TaxID=578461 RepID=R0MLB0_NOSB1|nr:Putative deoxyribonuclease TATDN1 [Nosema bombycis CQ1]|eukprot:EOB15020.1 Putative deoxyribonuclease TATDN1 [Nosema bombycis CQ1]